MHWRHAVSFRHNLSKDFRIEFYIYQNEQLNNTVKQNGRYTFSRISESKMDAIKKKMVSLSTETDTATARANKFDDEALAASKYV